MSLLQEYVKKHGTDGLNKKYVDKALANGGGNGATAAGIYSPSLVDNNFITSFLSETRRYMQDAESDFGSVGYKNASSLYSSHFDRLNDLKKRRDAISMYLKGNKDKFDEEFYNTFTSDLDLYGSAFEEYQSAFKSTSDFYSQFDTEQDYNDYVAAEEDRKQKLSFDLSAGKKELDDLYAQRDEARQIQNRINGLEWQVNEGDGSEATQMALEKLRAQLKQYGYLDSTITQKEQYYNEAKRLQSGEKLKADAVNAADFEEFAQKGADIKNPTTAEAERGFQLFGWKPFAEQVGNEVTYSRENYDELALAEMMGTVSMEGKSLYHYMTDEEVKIYNYYLAKDGKDKADEYLYSIEESLNARQGGVLADSAAGNLALQYLLGAAAGLDQFASGVKSIFSDEDYINTSAMQFASGMVREDLSETGPKVLGSSLGQVGYDLINTTANMAPSILASTIISTVATPVAGAAFGTAVGETIGATAGKVVGAGLLGASAGGNAYAEKLNAGYSKDQAAAYGMMVAASEAGLEYLIGGISKMGGKLTGKSIEAIANNIDNAVGRVAAKWGMSMLAEGTEEYLQDVLNPWYENIVFNMNNDVTLLSEEALYSGLLGALSAGVLEGRSTVSADRAMTRYGESLKKDGLSVERLKSLGQTFAADTVAYELAGKVDENTGAYTIARLFNEVNAQLSEQNKADIVKSLESKGYATKHAEIIANQLAAAVDGAEFGALQRYVLDHNEDIAKTFADVILNPNSTVNQRRVQSTTSLFELAKEVDKARVQAKYAPTSPVMKSAEQYDADAKTAATNSSATLAPPERFRSSIEINFDEGIPASPEALARSIAESRRVSPVEQMAAGLAAAEKKAMGGLTVSKSGKVEHKPTGKEIGKLTIVSDKDKKLKLKTESGEIVDAKDVNFRSKDEAMVYSAVLGMGVNPVVAQSIVDNFDGTDGMVYAADVKLAYQYGKMNFPKRLLENLEIKPYQAEHAYKLGRSDAKVAKSKTGRSTQYKRGSLVYEYDVDESTLTPMQKVGIDGLKMLADLSSVRFHIFESTMTEDGYRFTKPDGTVTGANGWYSVGTNDIWVDINSGNFGQGLMLHTVAHEISHYIKEWSPAKWQAMADFLLEQYGEKGVPVHILLERQMQKVKRRNPSLKGNALMDAAYEELVSDAMSEMLVDGRVAEKMQALKKKDAALWEKIKDAIKDLLDRWGIIRKEYKGVTPEAAEAQFLHDMDKAFSKLQDMFAEAFADADANFSAAEYLSTDTQPVETSVKHSFRSLAEAAGFGAMELEDGTKVFLRDRQRVSRVTLEDIENSPIGAMINFSVDMKDITTNDADRQKKMFRDFCNMAIKTGDFNMTMQFAGSAVFTGMKANADKQYGTTYDFPSICTKTQAVIDAMSARMVKLGRGLISDEIVEIYRKVFASGNPVPCPECYVFSRWIGIGGLLDNIKTYQDTYGKMSVDEAAAAYDKLHKQIEEIAKEKGISFGKAKGKLASDLQKEYNKLKERIEKNQNQGEKVKPADAKRLADLEPMMTTVKALTWLENVYFADEKHTKINKNFRVPDNVLFDLNNGEAFATQYKEAWAFRTTQGAGYGKAITPYAEASLGEGILVTNNTANAIKGKANGTLKNYFLDQKGRMDGKAVAALKKARAKQKNQAFIGGQRFQSTSDARYENASDYLLAALEMQAMGGMVQVYTKVDGAVSAFSAWGFSINQSLMPLGGGLDANGNVKDTSTGGMNPDVAFRNREKHETAGTITIGVNDNHIRKMFAQWERDFIIPYHASGGKATIVAEFRDIQEKREAKGAKVRSTDYSRTQSDKVLSDEVLRWMGRTEDEIRQIHAVRDARIAILTGKSPNMDVVRGNRFLSNLYDKLRTKDGEWYGVVLAKGKVEGQIFPNEFWDQSVSYEDSAKITEDYLAYCKDLGILHRFSGMVPQNGILRPVTGYNERGERVQLTDLAYKYKDGEKTAEVEPFFWKVLTDRRMYDNSKKYLPQKRVTLNDTTTDTVVTFATGNYGRQYNKELSQETAAKLADAKLFTRDADGDYDIKLSDRDSLTPDQQKHFDYNQKQETVGSTLKTLKGSAIKRSTKYGVGKEIGGEIYFHKEYAEDILPAEVLSQAERLLEENHPGFEYNCLKYNPKTGVVAFQEAPDFDTAREPVVGDYVSVNTDTGVVKTGHSNYIWHHKWNWVKNDYSGFDVEESWNWSKEWLSTLTEVSDGNGIERWNAQLDKFGLPKDGEEVLYSDREQEYDSKDTSVKILPATFTKFGLKPTDRVLDWGGGQYDIAKKAVEHGYPGIKFEVVDAFNRSETHNDRILAEYKADPATVLTINNVLNVIKETEIIEDVIRESKEYLAADGVCYIKIYEGNDVDGKTGNGKVTSSGWQNNQPAEWYRQFAEKYYKHVERVGDILIASDKSIDRKSLPKVDKDVAGAMRGKVKEIAKSEASMREALYSDRDIDSVSNRDILANAFMDVAQDDVERGKIAEYQQKIKALDEDERKLRDIRAQLHDLSFSAGPRDNAKIRELREKATKLANRIGSQDKELLRLEASEPLMAVLEREKKLAYSRASQKWEDRIETARTGRSKTEMRHKIKKIVGELNNLLLHGTKDKHIMIGLQKATAEALSAINMDTVDAENRLAKIQAKIDKATDPAEKARLQQSYARVEAMGDNMATRLTALKNAYEEIKDSGDPLVANAYQPEIEERIKNLRKMVGDTPLRNMSMEQLEFTYDTYKMVLTTIRNANKAFKNERGESIAVLGNRSMEEIGRVGGKKELVASAMRGPLGFAWSGMKPTYAFKAIGSDTLSEVFSQVRSGEDVWATDVNEAKEFYSQKTKQYNYDSWDLEKEYTFTSKSGKEFKLTLEQIMSLYAYSKRKQADAHLEKGGFVFDSSIEVVKRSKLGIPVKYRVNTAHAHALSRDTLMEICKTLTDEQVKFVDEMQDYLSTVMGEKGNEVSLKMYGVKLFKEKFYFPLKSAKQFMYEQYEVAGDRKIKNSGFSKDTTPHASNPVILNNFTDVWATHVNDMAMYHAFVLPMEDFERVFNYKTPTSDTMPTESVKGYLQDAYGVHPEQYIKQLMTDLNGGARIDPTAGIINKGIALFKKSAVFASLSVVIQQPSAIARAMAYIDAKYFVGKPGLKDWDEVKKYAPVAIIKEMGYFDTNMGKSTVEFIKAKEYTGVKSKMKALVTDRQYRDEILSKAPSVADELAWCQIWNAVKKEIAETKNLQGEELLQAAGKRFTEVIVNTQVYDSVLTRSGMMRSKDTGMKMATSFMAEPTTSLNMIADALIQGKRGNKGYARKTIGAVAASMILNSILVSFVYAGRDDDEDKTYIEKYAGSLTSELIDSFNPLTLIPFVKDIVSIAQGYDVERSDMAVITDLFNAWKKLSSDNLSVYRKVEGFGGTIASIFGLPLKNIMRDVRGIYNTVKSAVAGPDTTGRGVLDAARESLPKWMGGGERSNADQLYTAMLSGDTGHVERLKARFKDDRAFTYAVRDGLVNNDKRITAAAEARAAGNQTEYMRLAREIVNEGHFSQDDVVRAVNYVLNSLTKKESEPAEATKPDTFKIDEYLSEALSGDQAEAELVKREIIAGHVADGQTEDEALKSFSDSFKNTAVKGAFTDGDITMDVAIAMLQQYGGVESADAYADVQYWQFKKEHPDIYVADGWFDSYYMDAEGSGISIDVYMRYRNAKKGVEGKANIMRVIDSMPLSSAQKDALYFGEGWASSTLHEAPWR